jgi:hypothetical protein
LENATLAFNSLVEKTKLVLWSFNDDLKSHISASIDLESKGLREEISKIACFALNAMVISFGIIKGLTTPLYQTLALYTVLTNENAKLFQWTEIKEEDFIHTFHTVIHDMTPVAEFSQYSDEDILIIEEYVPHLLYVIFGICAKAWDAYIADEDELRKQEKLKAYLALQLKERATSLTAMDLEDPEPKHKRQPPSSIDPVLMTDGLEVSADLREQLLWFSTTSCISLILLDECGTGQHVPYLKFLPSREEEENKSTVIC